MRELRKKLNLSLSLTQALTPNPQPLTPNEVRELRKELNTRQQKSVRDLLMAAQVLVLAAVVVAVVVAAAVAVVAAAAAAVVVVVVVVEAVEAEKQQ